MPDPLPNETRDSQNRLSPLRQLWIIIRWCFVGFISGLALAVVVILWELGYQTHMVDLDKLVPYALTGLFIGVSAGTIKAGVARRAITVLWKHFSGKTDGPETGHVALSETKQSAPAPPAMDQLSSESRALIRTRRWILGIVGLPALLLVAGILTPPGRPKDAIAVSTCFVWLAAPLLTLAGVALPYHLPREFDYRRRIIRATYLSLAAFLLVGDFWLMGIGAGLAQSTWNIETIPAAVLLGFALLQFPLRNRRFDPEK